MNDSSTPTPGRSLASTSPSHAPGRSGTGIQRTAGALRTVLPHLLRLLPLLDGNIGSAVSNLLVPPQPAPPPPPPVNLEPIENGLAELKTELQGLRGQVSAQNSSHQQIESRLEMVEAAAARDAVAHQELLKELKAVGNLVEELKAAGRKTKVFAAVALVPLALLIMLNLVLLLRALHTLP